ncbi:Uncharacterised protein [Mycobacteroides abscessus subsp. abscessus]|nr:Uncharacterised protein [Mycobacteroides abscessus subsp. abscessus]
MGQGDHRRLARARRTRDRMIVLGRTCAPDMRVGPAAPRTQQEPCTGALADHHHSGSGARSGPHLDPTGVDVRRSGPIPLWYFGADVMRPPVGDEAELGEHTFADLSELLVAVRTQRSRVEVVPAFEMLALPADPIAQFDQFPLGQLVQATRGPDLATGHHLVARSVVEDGLTEVASEFELRSEVCIAVRGTQFHSIDRKSVLRQHVLVGQIAEQLPLPDRAQCLLQSRAEFESALAHGLLDQGVEHGDVGDDLLLGSGGRWEDRTQRPADPFGYGSEEPANRRGGGFSALTRFEELAGMAPLRSVGVVAVAEVGGQRDRMGMPSPDAGVVDRNPRDAHDARDHG